MEPFDLNPNPRVLLALTHTAMKPMDALCELVDNAIDSLTQSGFNPEGAREIKIDLPTITELNNGVGAIRCTDNGPGMMPDDAAKALTAGYSGKNAHDQLGMFGMGLNIATGKFSRTTRLITATKDSKMAIVVEVDLNQLVRQGNFKVHPSEEPKEKHFRGQESGTIIELSDWWGQGSPNKDFPRKLVLPGPGKIRETLGRRYATLLRGEARISTVNLLVKGERCIPFEHCVWGASRFVMSGSTQYPAQQSFNAVLREQLRCIDCDEQVEGSVCPVDSSHKVRQVEERVRGWIGVQRFDNDSDYGIDLIRNGRAIRVQEKDAFFNFTDDTGKVKKDYPIDGPYGRIVGEVHLDHVRVDFAKQDFIRVTAEWQRALEFLRGNSSLQAKQPGASENNSPVKKIYDGYRRVRRAGHRSMYMGERPQGGTKSEPERVSRDLERAYYEKFLNREEGYYDDAKWWDKVEEAEQPALSDEFADCPQCATFQNPANAEVCGGCGALLLAKKCSNPECAREIPQSAPTCGHCGKSQVPEGPWKCQVCGHKNSPDSEECRQCGKPKGAVNALALEMLIPKSTPDSALSVQGLQITLPDGNESEPFDLETRMASLRTDRASVPAVVFTAAGKLQIFLDKAHPAFSSLQLRPEHAVAVEAAAQIRADSMNIKSGAYKDQHNLISLQGKILDKYWRSELTDNPGQIRVAIATLMEDIRAKMSETMQDLAEDIFAGMSSDETKEMVLNMKAAGADISQMGELKQSGLFMLHVPPETVISAFREHPGRFFDKKVWDMPWRIAGGLPEENVREVQEQTKKEYLNCLEDCIGFLDSRAPASAVCRRASLSLHLLLKKMTG